MKLSSTIFVLLLFSVAFAMGQKGVDRVSEAGEKLLVPREVEATTDGVKRAGLELNLDRARERYEYAIASDSTYAPARYSLAKILMRDMPDSAMLHARKAYESDTLNHWYLSLYAQSVLTQERYDEAQALYEKLILLRPRDLNTYRILAILYQQKQQPHQAIALLDTAEMKAGRNPYLVALKRQILLSINHTERALREAREMVDEDPYSPENRVALAELYLAMERDSLAEVEYGEAMMIDSTNLETLLSWGNYLERRKREPEYLEVLRRIMSSDDIDLDNKIVLLMEIVGNNDLYRREYLRVGNLIMTLMLRYPNDPKLIEFQGQHLIYLGMVESALELFKSHLNDEPPTLGFYHSVVSIERHLGRMDSVELYLRQAIDKFPKENNLKYERAYILTSQKRYDEAINSYKAQLPEASSDSLRGSIWGIIGDVYHLAVVDKYDDKSEFKREMKSSYKSYDKALRFNPDNSLVLNNYAYFLCEYGGDLKRAEAMARRAIELEKSNPTYLDTYAWILYNLGRYDEAKVIMRQAISFDTTKNGEIALHYGEILSALNEMTMANFYWDQARKWGMSKEQVTRSRERAARLRKEIDGEL